MNAALVETLKKHLSSTFFEDGELSEETLESTFRRVRGCIKCTGGYHEDAEVLYYRGKEISRNDLLRGYAGHYTTGTRCAGFETLADAKTWIDENLD